LTGTYTPAAGFSGTDTFTIQARGRNNDGANALNSGDISVSVTVTAPAPTVESVPALGTWGMIALAGLLVLAGCTWSRTRVA
jgi:hypothetical protein